MNLLLDDFIPSGRISDAIGRRKPVMLTLALGYTLCWLPMLYGVPMSSFASHALFLAMGLCASSFTLTWACAKEVNPHALSGMATSVVNTGGFLGTAIMQPLVGWAIDQAGNSGLSHYQSGIAIVAGFSLLGWISVFFIKETYCKYTAS